MPGLAAVFLLAGPTLGLSLTPPSLTPLLDLTVGEVPAMMAGAEDEDESGGDASPEEATSDEASGDEAGSDEAAAEGDEPSTAKAAEASAEEDDYNQQTKRRNSLVKLHRPLGIATWAAMTATVGLGVIQYYNLYGFFADQGRNPCVQGNAIFGQGQCTGVPWPHAVAAGVTTALYATTFTVSLMMPDPDDLSSGKGEFASTLRLHKFLRWIHFGGMIAQGLLGVIIANHNLIGLDRANDYDTLQALATVHLATGIVTYGALSWAGALMTF